jgi:hypothetical protein
MFWQSKASSRWRRPEKRLPIKERLAKIRVDSRMGFPAAAPATSSLAADKKSVDER